jgi:hypothetical protein
MERSSFKAGSGISYSGLFIHDSLGLKDIETLEYPSHDIFLWGGMVHWNLNRDLWRSLLLLLFGRP